MVLLVLPLHTLYNTCMARTPTYDLIVAGQQFGRWTVLEDQRHSFVRKVLCKCVCGAQRTTGVDNLNRGRSNSCGCLTREKLAASGATRRKHHLNPGDKYGRLTVVNADKYARVECLCDCGNTHYVGAGSLYRNMTKSCGCLHIDQAVALGKSVQLYGGASKNPLFGTWQRNVQGYRHVHEPWRKDVNLFIKEVEAELGKRPKDALLLFHDEDKGLVPGNVYWGRRFSRKGPRARLTPEQRREIAALVKEGFLQYEVAQVYQVSGSLVSAICRDPKYAQ